MSQDLLTDHFDNGMSYALLSAKYGLSISTIGKRIKASGRVRDGRSVDRRSSLDTEPLSKLHKRIGMHFIRWRTIDNNFTSTEAAKELGLSLNRLHQIEGGIHHWTLLELLLVCERMGWTFLDLIRGATLNDYLTPENP